MTVQDFASGGPRAAVTSELGFEPLDVTPTAWLELDFTCFDAYLAAMRSQYRRRVSLVYNRSSSLRVERR